AQTPVALVLIDVLRAGLTDGNRSAKAIWRPLWTVDTAGAHDSRAGGALKHRPGSLLERGLKGGRGETTIYEPASLLKLLLVFWPMTVTAPTHTAMMRLSMTQYSMAVGPSSFFRN